MLVKNLPYEFFSTEVAKASGNAGAVLASGLSVAGGTFLITTGVGAPAGIGLVAAGMGLGLTSGFTKVGASVVSKVLNSNSLKKADQTIETDLKAQEEVTKATQKFKSEYEKLAENVPKGILDDIIKENLGQIGADRVNRAMLRTETSLSSEEEQLNTAGMAEELGKEITRDVAGAVLQVGIVEASGVIIGLNTIFAIKEAYDFVNIVSDLINNKGTEAASELRKIAKELEKNLNANNKSKTITNAFENQGFMNDQREYNLSFEH